MIHISQIDWTIGGYSSSSRAFPMVSYNDNVIKHGSQKLVKTQFLQVFMAFMMVQFKTKMILIYIMFNFMYTCTFEDVMSNKVH